MAVVFKSTTTKEEAHKIWAEWRETHKEECAAIRKCCAKCGTTQKVYIHHIDGDKTHNDPSTNLMGLCQHCHRMAHQELVVTYPQSSKKNVESHSKHNPCEVRARVSESEKRFVTDECLRLELTEAEYVRHLIREARRAR